MMRKSWIAFLVVLTISLALFFALRRDNRGAYSTAVLPGTWTWDVDSNSFGGDGQSDFWWEQVYETNRYLVPQNGAVAAVVSGRRFEAVDERFTRQQHLSSARISGSDRAADLSPGTVVVFRTSQGRYGKLQVIRYRAIDDFRFPEASHLSPPWRDFATTKFKLKPPGGNRMQEIVFQVKRFFRRDFPRRYHLEIRWQLFANGSNDVGAANGSQPIGTETKWKVRVG